MAKPDSERRRKWRLVSDKPSAAPKHVARNGKTLCGKDAGTLRCQLETDAVTEQTCVMCGENLLAVRVVALEPKLDTRGALTRNDERVLRLIKEGRFELKLARDYQALKRLIERGWVERTAGGFIRALPDVTHG